MSTTALLVLCALLSILGAVAYVLYSNKTKKYTIEDIEAHNNAGGAWLPYKGSVYDLAPSILAGDEETLQSFFLLVMLGEQNKEQASTIGAIMGAGFRDSVLSKLTKVGVLDTSKGTKTTFSYEGPPIELVRV